MSSHRTPIRDPRRTRTTMATTAGILLAVLALLLTLPQAASAASPSRSGDGAPPVERGKAWMGMTIAEHEGGDPYRGRPDGNSRVASVEGVDVSSHQGAVDWPALWNSGVRFAYVKATEGTYYENEWFAQQYNGSYNVGMIRGSYHFANPSNSSGAAQARFFVNNGGGWSRDGKTLPGVLDIEYNPYGADCYGLTDAQMVNWIRDFTTTYKALTGRDAVIYTTTNWWTLCTGNNGSFGSTNPLWIARWGSSPGPLPNGWGFHTFWQYTSTGPIVGDHNLFNGSYQRLKVLANGG